MKMPSPCVFSRLQASGVTVWARSVAPAGFRRGQYGVFTRRAGRHTIPTASTWTSQRASGTALRSATGTRTSLSGMCQTGGAVFLSLSLPMSSCQGQLSASQHNMASRGAKSTVYAPQTAPLSPHGYASSFPRSQLLSRRASSPAPKTVSFQTSTPGHFAAKPAALACSIGLDMSWPHQCTEVQTVPTWQSSGLVLALLTVLLGRASTSTALK